MLILNNDSALTTLYNHKSANIPLRSVFHSALPPVKACGVQWSLGTEVRKRDKIGPMSVPSGSEVARPFLPARDFGLSKRFYEAIGFVKLLDGDVAIFGIGTSSFILQNRFDKAWAENSMMQLMVDDLDSWWRHIEGLDLPTRFGTPEPKAPALQPWGLRVAFVVDPSGVLWHVAQRRSSNSSEF